MSSFLNTRHCVKFTINGTLHTVPECTPTGSSMSLNVYIRDYVKMRGTKAMCHEGGCGACIVAVEIKGKTMAVNSCLVPILICDGWAISTIEGLGNRRDGYHIIQATLAKKNGSQCGYCSPGMVMNLYSLVHGNKVSMEQIENSFGGNICRCIGYRPILDAFKGFASDAPQSMVKNIRDIEELYTIKACSKYGFACTDNCCDKQLFDHNTTLYIKLEDAEFYKVYSIEDLFAIFQLKPNATYILNGGNTAQGVYRSSKSNLRIDVNDIPDLNRIEKTDKSLTLGGNVSLTATMETFEKYSSETGFKYLRHLAHHIDLIANVPVRNTGSIAGNLMIKHAHNEFPSDVFLILETAGTHVHILEASGKKNSMTLFNFLKVDMHHKIIYSVELPAISYDYEYRSYKIMPRAQNAHAHVNAGFLFKLSGGKVLERPNIIFAGINKSFFHAKNTEKLLVGKFIFDKIVLKTALETLYKELQPDHVLPDYSPEFRKNLAIGLFYKFILSIKPESVNFRLRSGGSLLKRGLSSGTQDYDTDKNVWPVSKPVTKLDAIQQTSGEALYCNDLPSYPREVFCAFVLTEIGNGTIDSIDASKALAMRGVLAFYSAKDIPGPNLCISAASKLTFLPEDELLFAEQDILYAGQPVGVIVAETHNLANEAAKFVKIRYSESLQIKPVISIEDALATQDDSRFKHINVPAKRRGNNIRQTIKGVFECGSQYHYTMETQSCVCIPMEDGMDVYPSSQWPDINQVMIANCLAVKNNSINVQVKRIGGGYGAKVARSAAISCTCALVCHKLNRPARFIMTIESNMQSQGKRDAARQEYEVGIDDEGVIQYLVSKQWSNCGSNYNEPQASLIMQFMESCYINDNWTRDGFDVRTDIPSNTYARAPGSTEGVAMIENIMEHIAKVIKKDPLKVRLVNMSDVHKAILEPMIKDFSKSADYEIRKRAVETFNNENRWKKKGIALVPMAFPLIYDLSQFNAMVSVCARDGTVCVTHGGIECGQGINTKVAQVAAYTLGIDLSFITIKPSNNLITPNNQQTSSSLTSDTCAYATIQACKKILTRLEPIKKEMGDPTWPELIFAAYQKDVDLCARHMYTTSDDSIKSYYIYGVTIAEVEIDVLTGQHIIRRVDLIEDAGISLNPEIDVGQVEGAFVMGIGYWTCEDLIFDPRTGALTNDRTWNYKVPGAKDVPEDFRVSLLKNSINTFGVLRSKSTGEPPLCMSYVIPIAIRYALNSARVEVGNTDEWYRLDGPCTTERILLSSLTSKDNMVL